MNKLAVLGITLLLTYKGTSQTNQKAANEMTTLPNKQLLKVIESNEIGKIARKKVPLLEEKIYYLDSNIALYKQRIEAKDALINKVYDTLKTIEIKSMFNDSVLQRQAITINVGDKQNKQLVKSLNTAKKSAKLGWLSFLISTTILIIKIL